MTLGEVAVFKTLPLFLKPIEANEEIRRLYFVLNRHIRID